MSIVLGIDLATADVRVEAVDVESGDVLATRHEPLAVMTSGDGSRTQSSRYGTIARALIAAVARDLGDRAQDVAALSVTGTSGTVVAVDERGVPVGDAVMYDDPAGVAELGVLASAGRDARPVAALARAAWMHARRPAARYVFTPDVVVAALAGRLLPSDTSHALKSGIDPVAATWDDGALAALRLPRERMPALVSPGTVVGEVTDPEKLGLSGSVVIVAGMTDGSTGQIATGAVAEGDTVGVLGTTLVVKAVAASALTDGAAGIYSHVGPDGRFWAGGASNSGAGLLSTGITAGIDLAAQSDAVAAAGRSNLVTYPLPRRGERFPVSSRSFAGFCVDGTGAPARADDPIAWIRAVYEGVAFVERLGLSRLEALGARVGTHHSAGGASASDVWNGIRASALGRPVVVSPGAGSARGAAVLAALGLGVESFADLAVRFAGRRYTVDPEPTLVDALEERFGVFTAALAEFA